MGVPRWLATLLATLFLLHGTAAAPTQDASTSDQAIASARPSGPVPPLFLKGGSKMREDILTFYSSRHCPFDDKIFKDGNDTFQAGGGIVLVYNAVTRLLSLIEKNQWIDEMCEASLVEDLTSRHFCSTPQSDLPISGETVRGLNSSVDAGLALMASQLQLVHGNISCVWWCGEGAVSGICNMFAVLADFVLSKKDNENTAHPTPQEQPTQPENSPAALNKTPSVQQAPPTPPNTSTDGRKDVGRDISGNSGYDGTPAVSNKDSAELVQYLQDNREVMSQLLTLLREQKLQLNGGGRQGGEPPKVDGHPETSQQWTPSRGENLHQGESPGQGWVSHSDENPFQKSGPPQDQSHSQGWITSQDQNFPQPSLNSGPSQGESPPLKSGPPQDESHSQGWITSQDQNFPRPPPNSGPSQGESPPRNSGLSQSSRTPEDQSFHQFPQNGGPSQTQEGEPSHVQMVAPPPGDMGKPGDSSPKDNNGIATDSPYAMPPEKQQDDEEEDGDEVPFDTDDELEEEDKDVESMMEGEDKDVESMMEGEDKDAESMMEGEDEENWNGGERESAVEDALSQQAAAPADSNEQGTEKVETDGVLNEEEVDFYESEDSGGYSPWHFISIFLVLAVIAVIAYLCVHNKKKIKEGVRDYMSDTKKRRRTRDYKPLLSGKK